MTMGCSDVFIHHHGASKCSEVREDSFFLPSYGHSFVHGSCCVPRCSLASQLLVSETPYLGTNSRRYADVAVHPCLGNGDPNSKYGMQDDARTNLVQENTLTRSTHYPQLPTNVPHELRPSVALPSATIVKGSEMAMDKTGRYGSLYHTEKPALHKTVDDDIFLPNTIAVLPSIDDLTCLLKECRQKKDPAFARQAHFQICCLGLDTHTELGNYLVPMFVDCCCLEDGQKVFDRLIFKNEHSWTSLIQGSVDWGDWQNAFNLFKGMEHSSVHPSTFTFVALLKACAIKKLMEVGRGLHREIIKQGLDSDSFVGNVLVDMYSKCGSLEEAREVFDKLPVQDAVSWNTLIDGYVEHGHSKEALSCLDSMQAKGLPYNELTFISGLKASSIIGDLDRGREIHAEIAREGYECCSSLGSTLVDMYAKCGSLLEAREVFHNVTDRDAISWNPLITAYAEYGLAVEALECLKEMKLEGYAPDAVALAGCMKACGSVGAIREGHEIHADCIKQGMERDFIVGSALVDMYSKSGAMAEAQEVFNMLPVRGVVPWTALIAGYTDCGLGEEALNCLEQMQVEGVLANDVTLMCCLKACSSIKAEERGRQLHMAIAKEGFETDPFIGSALVDMYAKCGALSEALELFTRLPVRGVVVWTALIAGYTEEGLNEEALDSFKQMQLEDVIPNAITFVCSLKACGNLAVLSRGLELHGHIVIEGFELEPLVGTSLVDMYVKCGSLPEAHEVFEKLPARDVAMWNVMIAGCVDHELCEEALSYYYQMCLEGISPNAITFVLLLKACGALHAIGRGQETFMQITKKGLEKDSYVGNALIDCFAKCGCLVDAQEELEKLAVRDVVSWNSLIAGHTEHGFYEKIMEFTSMMKSEGLSPDGGTFVCCLKACSNMRSIDRGYEVHMELVIEGFENDILVGNTLVDMYAKCGCLVEGQDVFHGLQVQDVVTWTALIGGYAVHGDESQALICFQEMQFAGVSPDVMTWNIVILGYAEEGEGFKAFNLYGQMQEQGLLPNVVTFTNTLKACGSTATLEVGRRMVAHIYGEAGLAQVEIVMENAIVDMYGRCGSMAEAQQAFDAMPSRQLVTWNGLITGYARQGESEAVFSLMLRMKHEGFQPNEVTLLCVLNACNHVGLVDMGKKYFKAMETDYHLDVNIMHHNCMIDLLSRAGRFGEVWAWLKEMPIPPNYVTWLTVLSACQAWVNVELGRYAFESLLKLDGSNKAAFVTMGNIYAKANMWDELRKIEVMKASLGATQYRRTWI